MKKFLKILLVVILLTISVVSFLAVTHHYKVGIGYMLVGFERIVYFVWMVTAAVCFGVVVNEIARMWVKISLGALTSVLVTTAVFITNNFWRFFDVNRTFGQGEPITYETVVKWDINYTYGYGEYRYPLFFVLMLLVCGLMIFITHPRIKKACGKTIRKQLKRFFLDGNVQNEDIESLYLEVINPKEVDRFFDAVMQMPVSMESKNDFAQLVEKYRDDMLITLLVVKFGDILTEEEYAKYKSFYTENNFAKVEQNDDLCNV